jgi:hypothetical protein
LGGRVSEVMDFLSLDMTVVISEVPSYVTHYVLRTIHFLLVFNVHEQLYALLTLYLCVLYLSEDKT